MTYPLDLEAQRGAARALLALLLATLLLVPLAGAAVPGELSDPLDERDAALINEAFHLVRTLAPEIWPDFALEEAPFLYKTPEHDVLFGHPGAPEGFEPARSAALGRDILVRPSTDQQKYRAAYPIAGAETAVMAAPDPGDDPCLWVLKAAHELFHVWQAQVRPGRIVNPFEGRHADKHELSYPFPHDDEGVLSAFRVEAEHIFQVITAQDIPPSDRNCRRKVFGHLRRVLERVLDDELDARYKRWMEWKEGVARYTERELASLARDAERYEPTAAFIAAYPDADYAALWEAEYAGALSPVRFAGEGVRGRVVFYYLGMGKAYALDRLLPGWRELYFDRDLDALLAR